MPTLKTGKQNMVPCLEAPKSLRDLAFVFIQTGEDYISVAEATDRQFYQVISHFTPDDDTPWTPFDRFAALTWAGARGVFPTLFKTGEGA